MAWSMFPSERDGPARAHRVGWVFVRQCVRVQGWVGWSAGPAARCRTRWKFLLSYGNIT